MVMTVGQLCVVCSGLVFARFNGVWPLLCGVVPHVRNVLLPCDDALLPALT
jgi:hypothetical protein